MDNSLEHSIIVDYWGLASLSIRSFTLVFTLAVITTSLFSLLTVSLGSLSLTAEAGGLTVAGCS